MQPDGSLTGFVSMHAKSNLWCSKNENPCNLPHAVAPVAQVVPPQMAGPRLGSQQPGMGMQRGRPMAGPRRPMVGSLCLYLASQNDCSEV